MKMDELKAHYGTWTKMARSLELGSNTHQNWRRIGYIPYTTQLLIEKKTNGLFKADMEHAHR